MKGKKTGGGSRKGIPNKTTSKVREIIAKLCQGVAPKLQGWLDEVEDPGKRLDLALKLFEYDIPKLGRVELTGQDGGPLQVKLVSYSTPEPVGSETVPTEGVVRTRTGLPPRSALLAKAQREG